MNHQKKGRKFGRVANQRKAFLKALIVNLIKRGKIKTTEARAKEVRPMIEKLTTKAKNGTMADRRIVISRIGEQAAKKLFTDIAPKYKDRTGGYARITKLPRRPGDASKMAVIEFV